MGDWFNQEKTEFVLQKKTSPLVDILKTSLPAVIDLSSQTIMWTVEAILIGHLSAAYFAGVGMAIQVIILFFTIFLTFIVGSSIIINRHLGAGENWQANHIFGQALMIGIIMAFLVAVIWYFGATLLFAIIREKQPIAKQSGIRYLRIIALFSPLILTNFVAMGIMRGAGDTRITMIINLTINFLNLILAPLLIFGLFGFPRLEVKGAALAAGMAHTVGFFFTLFVLRTRRSVLFLSFREITTPNFKSFKRLYSTGMPTTIEQLFWAYGQMVITSYAALLGIYYLAAHQVFMRIQAILSMVYMGFSLGAMTLVGQNIGAEEHKRAEETGHMASYVMGGFVVLIVASLLIFDKPLISIFTGEVRVFQIGKHVIIIFALVQIPKALNNVISGNLRGAGDLKWLMYWAVGSSIVMETGATYFFAFPLGLSLLGLWLVQGIDETSRLTLNYFRFKKGRWKFIKI
ncbi:multidrug resistance protein NorM [bacterium BMS3Abin05]|nr:multidrug resistance protein NorM [bacterium BMS3Abin05]GBE28430.1 multidrug resistance protein NorM [bacterium BMS3Bbin03]